jgi:hypothetical protein
MAAFLAINRPVIPPFGDTDVRAARHTVPTYWVIGGSPPLPGLKRRLQQEHV